MHGWLWLPLPVPAKHPAPVHLSSTFLAFCKRHRNLAFFVVAGALPLYRALRPGAPTVGHARSLLAVATAPTSRAPHLASSQPASVPASPPSARRADGSANPERGLFLPPPPSPPASSHEAGDPARRRVGFAPSRRNMLCLSQDSRQGSTAEASSPAVACTPAADAAHVASLLATEEVAAASAGLANETQKARQASYHGIRAEGGASDEVTARQRAMPWQLGRDPLCFDSSRVRE